MVSLNSREGNQQSDQTTHVSTSHPSNQAQVSLIPHLARRLNPTPTGKKLTSGNTEKHWIQRFKRDELPNQQRSYKLSVLQQPVRARLSSFKEANETSDRRPIDPPVIVEVQSFEKETTEFRASNNFFVTATLVSAQSSSTASRFNLPDPSLRSPSVPASHTRSITPVSATDKSTINVPSPVLVPDVAERDWGHIDQLSDGLTQRPTPDHDPMDNHMSPTPTTTLVPDPTPVVAPEATSHTEHIRPTDPYLVVKMATGANATAGDWVMSTETLRDSNGGQGSFCVFSKLSIRVPGKFRLRFILYEKKGMTVQKVSSTVTDPFEVFSPKRYPGMMPSTELTRYFASQGMKLKLRAGVARSSHTSVTTEPDESIGEGDGAASRGNNGTSARGIRQTASKAGKTKAKETEKESERDSNLSQKSGSGKGKGRKRLAESPIDGPTPKIRSTHEPASDVSSSVLGPQGEFNSKNGTLVGERDFSIESAGEARESFARANESLEIDPVELDADDPLSPFAHHTATLTTSISSDTLQPPKSYLPSIRELALSTSDWDHLPDVPLTAIGLTGSLFRGTTDSWNQDVGISGGNSSQTIPALTRDSMYIHSSSLPGTSISTSSIISPSYPDASTTDPSNMMTHNFRSLAPTSFPYQHHLNRISSQGQSQSQSQVQNQNHPVGHLMQYPLESHQYNYPIHSPSYSVDHALYSNHSFSDRVSNTVNHGHLHPSPYSQNQLQTHTQMFQNRPPAELHFESQSDNLRIQDLAPRYNHMHSSTIGFHSEQAPPHAQQRSLHYHQYQHQQISSQHLHLQQTRIPSSLGTSPLGWHVQNHAELSYRTLVPNIDPSEDLALDSVKPPGRKNSTS